MFVSMAWNEVTFYSDKNRVHGVGQITFRIKDVEVELSEGIYHCVGTDQTNPFELTLCLRWNVTFYLRASFSSWTVLTVKNSQKVRAAQPASCPSENWPVDSPRNNWQQAIKLHYWPCPHHSTCDSQLQTSRKLNFFIGEPNLRNIIMFVPLHLFLHHYIFALIRAAKLSCFEILLCELLTKLNTSEI